MTHHAISSFPGGCRRRALASLALVAVASAAYPVHAQQVPVPKPDMEAGAIALRCELHLARAPDTTQVLYFYLSEARRTVYETDGNALGNVVQFGRQRIVVSRSGPDGGQRTYAFDRMIGSLTVSWQGPAGGVAVPGSTQAGAGAWGGRETWTLSGECQKVDASRQKF